MSADPQSLLRSSRRVSWFMAICPRCGEVACSHVRDREVVREVVEVVPRAVAERLAGAARVLLTDDKRDIKADLTADDRSAFVEALAEFHAAYPVSAPANSPQTQANG